MRLRTYLDSMRVLGVLAALAGCGGEEAPKTQAESDAGAKNDAATGTKDVCESICARSAAASCANDDDACEAECNRYVSETPARCKTQLSAFTTCAQNARFSCDDEGDAEATACDAQLDAWTACLQSDGGSTIDASTPDAGDASSGDAAICPLSDDEATCGVCVKFSCCEEIIACGAACQELVKCANACPSTSATDPCAQACYDKHPDGMAAFTAFASCLGTQCEDACSATP